MKGSVLLRPLEYLREELYLKANIGERFQLADSRSLTPAKKRALYLGFLATSLLAVFILYWGGLSRGPYIDDNILIFGSQHIRNAVSPLTYWIRGQSQTKAWPLTHTAYWLLFQVLGMRFWAYRSLNVLLHWAAGVCLFHFLARKVRITSAAFAACFFWFHPIAVGTVTWITQISTIATVLFLSWWLAGVQEKEDGPRAGILSFLAMVVTKGFAYLLPLVQLRKRIKQWPLSQAFLFTAPSILIAAYGLFLAFVGTYHNADERPFLQTYYENGVPVSNPVPAAPVVAPAPAEQPPIAVGKAKKKIKKAAKVAAKKKIPTKAAAKPVAIPVPPVAVSPPAFVIPPEAPASSVPPTHVFTKSLRERITITGKTFVYYVARVVSFSDLSYPEMRSSELTAWNILFFTIGLGIFGLLGWALVQDKRVLATGLLVYLPVSGLFYIPYLKFRLVSDHMVYPALFVFAWGLGLCVDRIRHKGLHRAYWLWPMLLAVFTLVAVREQRVEFPVEAAIPLHQGIAQ